LYTGALVDDDPGGRNALGPDSVACPMRPLVIVAIAVGALLSMGVAAPAVASVQGPCTSSAAGVDLSEGHDSPGSAIHVARGARVEVSGTARGAIRDLVYSVHVAGGRVNVGTVTLAGDRRSWNGAIDLANLRWMGVGVFELSGDVRTRGGDCAMGFDLVVDGGSLSAPAGVLGAAIGLAGILALAVALGAARRTRWAAVLGLAGGAAAAFGLGVLLQQGGLFPLTFLTAVVVPVVAGVLGAFAAIVRGRRGRSEEPSAPASEPELPPPPELPAPPEPTRAGWAGLPTGPVGER
jgi:hypothetical protein